MGKTDHGDNCQGENGGVKTAWGKCLWGFTDRIQKPIRGNLAFMVIYGN